MLLFGSADFYVLFAELVVKFLVEVVEDFAAVLRTKLRTAGVAARCASDGGLTTRFGAAVVVFFALN